MFDPWLPKDGAVFHLVDRSFAYARSYFSDRCIRNSRSDLANRCAGSTLQYASCGCGAGVTGCNLSFQWDSIGLRVGTRDRSNARLGWRRTKLATKTASRVSGSRVTRLRRESDPTFRISGKGAVGRVCRDELPSVHRILGGQQLGGIQSRSAAAES